ncbi:MAG: selenide, water dikinase SelD [Akkermansiaceae bacterium]|nr:selenide, water dikinase SelD [Akkermansiaceae bacterium]NNM30863.1 selenide, water dikinase SelD [Akkermansiaceae bacterium]
MRGLTQLKHEDLLVGSVTSDDAAVFRLDSERALVQTLDFFTPIVDDPYTYGQIAASNSLSDVYAMGGRPITAMNVVGVPTDVLPLSTVNEILKGGADKVAEAGCVLAGGHTVQNPEPIYGLSVTGLVHPDRLITNAHGKPGDVLVLTKPLGTGIVSTAIKRGIAVGTLADESIKLMATLNTPGTTLAERGLVHAGTDVTGFGLLGHLGGVARESGVTARIDSKKVPAIASRVMELIDEGCIPGGTRANLAVAQEFTRFADEVPENMRLLLADAQTSGGLLLAVPPDNLGDVMGILEAENAPCADIIGALEAKGEFAIEVV